MGKTKTPPTLAARVRYVRGLVPGLSMRALSRIAGLSPSMVGEIERGNRTRVERPTGVSLAEACGAPVLWMLEGLGDPPDASLMVRTMSDGLARLPPRGKSGPKPRKAVPQ